MISMRLIYLICLFFILAHAKAEDGAKDDKKDFAGNLEKLIASSPELQQIKTTCASPPPGQSSAECMWKKVQNNNPDLAGKLRKAFNYSKTSQSAEGQSVENKFSVEKQSLSPSEKRDKNDPYYKKLSEFYQKQINEYIYNLNPDGTQKNGKAFARVDYNAFTELYKTQLGKSMIESLTSYCLDATPPTATQSPPSVPFTMPPSCTRDQYSQDCTRDLKTNRDNNLNALRAVDFNKTEKNDIDANFKNWSNCSTHINYLCTQKNENNQAINVDKYTNIRACEVSTFLKQARQTLLAIKNQEDEFEKINKELNATYFSDIENKVAYRKENKQTPQYDQTKNSANSQSIVYTSTGQLEKEKINDANKEQLELINNACGGDGANNYNKANTDECKKILSKYGLDKEGSEKSLLEQQLRAGALKQERIDEINPNMDSKKLEQILEEQGLAKKDIDVILNDQTKRNETISEIKKQYESEINAISEKYKSKYQASSASTTYKEEEAVKRIVSELSSRTNQYKEVLHYSNIISAFISLNDKESGKSTRLTASVFSEKDSDSSLQGVGVTKEDLNNKLSSSKLTDSKKIKDNSTTESESYITLIKCKFIAIGIKLSDCPND